MKLANVYFVGIMILQMIPSITITSSEPYIMWSIICILLYSMSIDMVSECARSKMDNQVNGRKIEIFNPEKKTFEEKTWRNIKVGELIRVLPGSEIPADMVLLKA
jgi:phospholipid-transporting ATPase